MRILAFAAAALLASAGAALAAPASVSVTVGPQLQAKAAAVLGVRDVNDLAAELQKTVQARLAKTGAYDGARIELVLTDVTPNRPTFKQLSDQPSLSYRSFGRGGAEIDGVAVAANGAVTPIRYRYAQTDLSWSRLTGTWSDAEQSFQQFAYQLGRGERVASR
jgi:hypothetical protein